MKMFVIASLAIALALPACETQAPAPEPAGVAAAQSRYVETLVGLGRSAVIYENGDVILAGSPRMPGETMAGRICALNACDPTGALADSIVTIQDGGSYAGHERQAGGACVRVNYDCVNGTLVP